MQQFLNHFAKLFFFTFLTKLVIFCLHADFGNLISSSSIGYGTFLIFPRFYASFFTSHCFLFYIWILNNPLFITTPKNGDLTSMSIHEITHEDGNVHFGKILVLKVAFEDGDVHVLQTFQSLHQTKKRQENQCGNLTKCIMIIEPQLNQLVDNMTMVECKICSTIKKRNKLMVPKLDSLVKY
jgi:hypothetical protein